MEILLPHQRSRTSWIGRSILNQWITRGVPHTLFPVSCPVLLKLVPDTPAPCLSPASQKHSSQGKLFPAPLHACAVAPRRPSESRACHPLLRPGAHFSLFSFLSSFSSACQPYLWGSWSLRPRSTRAPAAAAWAPSASRWQLW